MIIKVLHYIFGYLTVEITGEFCERILNLFSLHKISIWNIERTSEKIFLCLKLKDFKKIRKIRGKTKIKIKIVDRIGVPFIVHRNRFRYGFLSGVFLFFLMIYALNLFVWRIEVTGNETVDTAEILAACEEIGLKNGIKKSKIDSYKMRDELLLCTEKLAWASVNLEGSVVTVNVSEIKSSADSDEICNIVADFNGVIKDIKVQKGSAAVLKGDAVQKGDLLISGVVSVTGHTYFTNATGVVTAEVEEKIPICVPLKAVEKVACGKTYKKYSVDFFNISLPLFLGKETRYFEGVTKVSHLELFGKQLPISVYTLEVSPYKPRIYQKSEEMIKNECEEGFSALLKEKGISDYQICNIDTKNDKNSRTTIYTVKYLKNIGIKEKILF